jgi:23S rRNA G2069 N7-methylase RlmK/C1962 C5-methylase RlmI
MNLRLSLAGTAILMKGHPWIAPNAQLSYRLPPPAGTLLKVQNSTGDFLGWALSEGPRRSPAFRVVSRERRCELGEAWWQAVVERALGRRPDSLGKGSPRRLLDGEADGVPGLLCEACGPLAFLSSASEGLAPFLPLIEKALIDQTRLRGLWRRFLGAKGDWEPWHRAPLAPLSAARFEAIENGLSMKLDLDADARALVPPWPVERRSWRAWAAGNCKGRRVLVLGPLDGEAAAAEAAKPERFQRLDKGFINGLKKAVAWRPDRLLVDVPLQSVESFGRFDAAKHGPRLLQSLAEAAAPGAELLLSSEHKSLAGAEAWEDAWRKAGLAARMTQVLAPGPDCPELPYFPEGRRRRAFVFSLAAEAAP